MLLAWLLAVPAVASAAPPVELEEVAPGVHVYVGPHGEGSADNLGAVGNAALVVGEEAAALIDTGGSIAFGRRLLAAVREVTPLPLRYVVITHVHPDHLFGAAAFVAEGTRFVGHHKLPRALAARGPYYQHSWGRLVGAGFEGSDIVVPELLVTDTLALDLGGRVLTVTAHRSAHTDHDLSVLDDRTGILFAGDLLFVERLPVVDGSLKGWLEVMDGLAALPSEHAVPGHGPALVQWPAAAAGQRRYLQKLRDGVRAVIAEGGRMEEAVERVATDERSRWEMFDRDHPRNVVTTFTELEWE